MSRAKKKRVRAMKKKIARRSRNRYAFTLEPELPLLLSLPGEPGVIAFKAVFAGTRIEGKITLP